MPRISIIMPAYGVERFISEAIESVLAQEFTDWELIVVDDGSKDRSAAIASGYAAEDNRIRVVSKPNGGLSDARNFGLRHAKGEYVHFFDSDDRIASGFYSQMLSLADNHVDIIIAGHTVEVRNVDEHMMQTIRITVPEEPVSNIRQLLNFIDYAWNKLFRREFLMSNNLTYAKRLYLVEDCEFMSRALQCTNQIAFVNNCDYHYISRPRATLSNTFDEKTLTFANDCVVYTQVILRTLGVMPKMIEMENEYRKFSVTKFLFQLLYGSKRGNGPTRYRLIEKILSLPNLQHISIPYRQLGMKDRVLLLAIRQRNIMLVQAIYNIKCLISH